MDLTDELIIEQTNRWIKSVVIDCNFCPFAAKALLQKTIRYVIQSQATLEDCLVSLEKELKQLDTQLEVETSFIILPTDFKDFEEYLDLVQAAELFIEKNNYEGIYQIASFHPDYCFQGADNDDAANYTNRSIYPMLHILRESSLTKALTLYPNPELIPEHNIEFAQKKGLQYMQLLRLACL